MEDRLEGVRTTAELLGTGLSAGQIRRMVRNGTLCSLRPGVYATAATVSALSPAVFHQLGLPPPDLQVWVGDHAEVIGRADFLWRRYNTIGEADGAFKYQTPARARVQLERDARLRAAGYEVVHFSWAEITRVPAQVVESIQVAFSRSGAR